MQAYALLSEKKVDKNDLQKIIAMPIGLKGKLNLLTAFTNINYFQKSLIFIDDENELTNLIGKLT